MCMQGKPVHAVVRCDSRTAVAEEVPPHVLARRTMAFFDRAQRVLEDLTVVAHQGCGSLVPEDATVPQASEAIQADILQVGAIHLVQCTERKKTPNEFCLPRAGWALQHQARLPCLQWLRHLGQPLAHERPTGERLKLPPASCLRRVDHVTHRQLLPILVQTLQIGKPTDESLSALDQFSPGLRRSHFLRLDHVEDPRNVDE